MTKAKPSAKKKSPAKKNKAPIPPEVASALIKAIGLKQLDRWECITKKMAARVAHRMDGQRFLNTVDVFVREARENMTAQLEADHQERIKRTEPAPAPAAPSGVAP